MNIRLPWKRRRRTIESASVVDLTAWGEESDDSITPIARPDSLSPLDHTLPVIDPDITDARLAITQHISELAEAGALDAGTGDVLDHWIDMQLEEWTKVVEDQAAQRRIVTARLIAQDIDNLVRENETLSQLRREVAIKEGAAAALRDQLNGHPAVVPPVTDAEVTAGRSREISVPVEIPESYLSTLLRLPATE